MAQQPRTWRLRIQLEHTPSPTDPKDAKDFYYVLGVFIVAWGRLENHFLHDIITIFNLQGAHRIVRRIPMTFEKRSEFWERAFSELPVLQPHRDDTMTFLYAIKDLRA